MNHSVNEGLGKNVNYCNHYDSLEFHPKELKSIQRNVQATLNLRRR